MLGQAKKRNVGVIGTSLKQTAVGGLKSASFPGLVFPFVSTYFSEQARIEMANYVMQDMDEGISISAVRV